MERLQWKISGEFICNVARQWFWDENRPYEKSEELLLAALVNNELTLDERKKIAQDIIEGRKKLIGVNECTLVDDNVQVRPIQDKIKQVQKKLLISEIANDIALHPLNYVDPYSASANTIESADDLELHSLEDVYRHFDYSEWNSTATKSGLWLLDCPEIVADAYGKSAPAFDNCEETEIFWKAIYEKIKDYTKSGFKERNERYLAYLRLNELDEEDAETGAETVDEDFGEILRKDLDEMASSEFANYLKNRNPGMRDYFLYPDHYDCFEGLIAPNGNFYSCDFGGHNEKAYWYILAYFNEFGYSSRAEARMLHADCALDKLIEYGWIATRYLPYRGYYITYNRDALKRISSAQKKAAWNAIAKHDIQPVDVSMIL